MNTIDIIDLRKEFKGNTKNCLALDGVNLQIKGAELFCFLGPNGCGKTTLIKILCTIILPTKGKVFVNGHDVVKEEGKVKSIIGLVSSDERSFYARLTLKQNLYFFASLYNLDPKQTKEKIAELSNLLDIAEEIDIRFQDCSTGIKQRLAIGRALLNNPKIIFIDELTKGLDPLIAQNLRKFIKEELVEKQKKTVIFTTHNLIEAVDLADRLAIMDKGRILVCGTINELRQWSGNLEATIDEIFKKTITCG
jgi:ABC-2 type transport system ATP-binding protein